MSSFKAAFRAFLPSFERYLEEVVESYRLRAPSSSLYGALRYGICSRGKRFRPFLVWICGNFWQVESRQVQHLGVVIEMLHAWSLMCDDLPCMDDESERRGLPTTHVVYGEALTVLGAHCVLIGALEQVVRGPFSEGVKGLILEEILEATGLRGLCGGQALDEEWRHGGGSKEELQLVRRLKTGKLFEVCCVCAGGLAALHGKDLEILRTFSMLLGDLFQVTDDLLERGDRKAGRRESTLLEVMSLGEAQAEAQRLYEEACACLRSLSVPRPSLLEEAASFVLKRRQ